MNKSLSGRTVAARWNAELLLSRLMDDEVLAIVKSRLTSEEIAALVLEAINPHRPLTTKQVAALGHVTPRAIRDRKARGEPT